MTFSLSVHILVHMETMTYTSARQNFKSAMDKVCADHVPLIITRQEAEPVVMMSLADYNAMEETLYLTRSPKNAARLLEAFEDAKAGRNLIPFELPKEKKKPRSGKKPRA